MGTNYFRYVEAGAGAADSAVLAAVLTGSGTARSWKIKVGSIIANNLYLHIYISTLGWPHPLHGRQRAQTRLSPVPHSHGRHGGCRDRFLQSVANKQNTSW